MVPAAQRPAFTAFLDTMPERYLTGTPLAQVPGHFELVNALREEWARTPPEEHAAATATKLRHVPEAEYSEFTISTRDRPGLFAMITGVLTANGMNIVGARINTSRDGIALDSFRVGHLDHRERVLEPERWDRVQQALGRVLRGEVDVETLVAASRRPSILERPAPEAGVATEVIVDNAIAADTTVLDVITEDRVGVLFTITHALHRLGLVIHLAKITTQVHQVLDVFYVTDERGAKIEDAARLAAIERELVTRIEALAQPAATAK
jgi:[protein-PII] uridylyltransferase